MGDRISGSFFTSLACFGEDTKSTGSVDFPTSFLARCPTVAEEDFFPNNGMVVDDCSDIYLLSACLAKLGVIE